VGVKARTAAAEEIKDVVAVQGFAQRGAWGMQERQDRQNLKRAQKRIIRPDSKIPCSMRQIRFLYNIKQRMTHHIGDETLQSHGVQGWALKLGETLIILH